MNERDMWWKVGVVGVVAAIGYFVCFPLEEKLKFGIDLYGGYSLLYEIDDVGLDAEQKRDLAERVMKVLQERVDPDGVMNLVWRPVGTNRLEIQMPRPSEVVIQYRKEYDQIQGELKAANLKRSELLLALARPASERAAALSALERGISSRKKLLEELTAIQVQIDEARTAKDNDRLSTAEDELEQKINALMATNVEFGRLQVALESAPGSKFRREELEQIKKAVPEQADRITRLVDAHDRWRQKRGRGGTLDDPADLQRLLRGAGVLDFRILAENDPAEPNKFDTYRANLKQYGPRPRPGEETFEWFEIEKPREFFKLEKDFEKHFERIKATQRFVTEQYGERYYVLAYLTSNKTLTHRPGEQDWQLKRAGATRDEQGSPAVSFELDERGGAKFDSLTRQNKGKLLCIFLDDKAVSAATIQDVIRTRGIIHGSFTQQEVLELVKKLNAGSLPSKLKDPPISVRAVGPSLGQANREAGMRSAIYGSIAVVAFSVIYYLYVGIIAVIALAMNMLLTLAVLAALGATLTLPGVAGLVLSVGMAVDANILINERIREELGKGTGLRMAIRLGYARAFAAILDSNLTTFITSVILYLIASEEIRGFGLTLAAGVAINLLTAVFMTRLFFEFMSLPRVPRELASYPMLAAIGSAAVGGAWWAVAHQFVAPENRPHSGAIGFGQLLVGIGAFVAGVCVLMWIARAIHRAFQGGSTGRLPMMKIVGVPSIDWYGIRRVFYVVSAVLTIGGLALFMSREPQKLYDIEFLGGTAAQIDLKVPGSVDEAGISQRLGRSADELRKMADAIAGRSTIVAKDNECTVTVPDVPADRMREFVQAAIGNWLAPRGVRESGPDQLVLTGHPDLQVGLEPNATAESTAGKRGIRRGIQEDVAAYVRLAADALADAQIQAVESLDAAAPKGGSYEIVSRVTSKEIVVSAILSSMSDLVNIAPALTFEFMKNGRMNNAEYFPVTDANLASVVGDPSLVADLSAWRGGVVMVLNDVSPPQSPEGMHRRLKDMRLQPGYEQFGWRDSAVIGLTRAASGGDVYTRVAVVALDENFPYDEAAPDAWRSRLAEPEVKLTRDALERQTSLSKITQFAPQVAQEAKTKAYIALVVSWLAIILYVWFRFGSVSWGTAAVAGLIHDVLVALGAVAASFYIAKWPIGQWLLIEGFRIDLALVAAMLTVVGYSVNDSIVVFDRIRENRGKLKEITPRLVTDSINQTLSRTILTSLTVIAVIIIMYVFGGRGIHGFMYAMLVGILIGSYSSVFVATPLLVAMQRWLTSEARPAS
ncbi:MAG: protein translocase subunit SecD [Phycisphaerae bacterium]|nr:protein translocase subunit SecD [Phycisphaerae bacterium]